MSQFNTLSPSFRESLHRTFGELQQERDRALLEKQQKVSQTSDLGEDTKENRVNQVMNLVRQFEERILKDWLFSLDDESRGEVKRLFTELNDISAVEFALLMNSSGACCPWKVIGDMFSPAQEEIIVVEDADEGPYSASPGNEPPGSGV